MLVSCTTEKPKAKKQLINCLQFTFLFSSFNYLHTNTFHLLFGSSIPSHLLFFFLHQNTWINITVTTHWHWTIYFQSTEQKSLGGPCKTVPAAAFFLWRKVKSSHELSGLKTKVLLWCSFVRFLNRPWCSLVCSTLILGKLEKWSFSLTKPNFYQHVHKNDKWMENKENLQTCCGVWILPFNNINYSVTDQLVQWHRNLLGQKEQQKGTLLSFLFEDLISTWGELEYIYYC